MAFILSIFVFIMANSSFANWGHRAGGDYFKTLPENSLISLEASLIGRGDLGPIQNHRKFKYLEFDVRETSDGKIVVFHDNYISRMIPNSGDNKPFLLAILEQINQDSRKKKNYKNLRIKDLELSQLKKLKLKGGHNQKIPTLVEYFAAIKKYNIKKPIVVEIKSFQTNKSKLRLIELVNSFKKNFMDEQNIIIRPSYKIGGNIAFISFKKKFKSFVQNVGKNNVCKKIIDHDLGGVYKARSHGHNFCR